jgi:putative FmdB family regulatory protein
MPTYDYRRENCKKSFTVALTLKQHDARRPACPKCGSRRVKQKVTASFAVTKKKL